MFPDFQQVLNFVGSNQPDAVFLAKNVSYGEIQGSLATDTKLQILGTDAASLNTDPVDSTDGIMHMSGQVYLQDGTYKFKLCSRMMATRIVVDGQIVAQYDGNQSPYSREG